MPTTDRSGRTPARPATRSNSTAPLVSTIDLGKTVTKRCVAELQWMQRRKDNKFTIKSIKAIKEEHPDPTAGVRDAV
eukprot:SAG11_NODE_11098_length_783_cov_2.692982_1_plen_76_part_10